LQPGAEKDRKIGPPHSVICNTAIDFAERCANRVVHPTLGREDARLADAE
jgi:hypothetical protein